MKVCVVSAHIYPKANAGAARVNSILQAFVRAAYDVTVISEPALERGGGPDLQVFSGIQVKRTRLRALSNRHSIILRLLSELVVVTEVLFYLLRVKTDFIFVSSPPLTWTLVTVLAARLRGVKYALDIRDLYPQVLFDMNIIKADSIVGRILLMVESWLYKHATNIFAATESLLSQIQSVTKTPSHLLRNGYDQTVFTAVKENGPGSPFTLLFHGNLGRVYDIELLVDYAKFLKKTNVFDIRIVILGSGLKQNFLAQQTEQHQLMDYITYLGNRPLTELLPCILSADVGVSAVKQGRTGEVVFPVKVYEYMACGLPVLITHHGEVANFVTQHTIGCVLEDSTPEHLHAAVLRLKDDPVFYRETSKKATQIGRQFERALLAKQMISCLEATCHKNQAYKANR